jgi:hypothetical protein
MAMPASHGPAAWRDLIASLESTEYWRLLHIRVSEIGKGHCRLQMAGREAFTSGTPACLIELAALTAVQTLQPFSKAEVRAEKPAVRFLGSATSDVAADARGRRQA